MVREDMKFVGYNAFYEHRFRIKERYNKLSRDNKILYKYYVYSRRQLTEHTCDLIWQFLNNLEYENPCRVTDEILSKECNKYRM